MSDDSILRGELIEMREGVDVRLATAISAWWRRTRRSHTAWSAAEAEEIDQAQSIDFGPFDEQTVST